MSRFPDYDPYSEEPKPKISRRKLLLGAAGTALAGTVGACNLLNKRPQPSSPGVVPTQASAEHGLAQAETTPQPSKVEAAQTATPTPPAKPTFAPTPTNTAITFGEGRKVLSNPEIKKIKINGQVDANLLASLKPQLDRKEEYTDSYIQQLRNIVADHPEAAIVFGSGNEIEINGKKIPTVSAEKQYEVEGEPGTLIFFCSSKTPIYFNREDPNYSMETIRGQFRFITLTTGIIAVFEKPIEGLKGAYIPPSVKWRLSPDPRDAGILLKLNKPYPHNQTLLSSSAYELH